MNFGVRSMLYRLKAKIDSRIIAEDEVKAAGWDRSDYSSAKEAISPASTP